MDGRLAPLAFDSRIPAATRAVIGEMADLGEPAAVFVGPVTCTG